MTLARIGSTNASRIPPAIGLAVEELADQQADTECHRHARERPFLDLVGRSVDALAYPRAGGLTRMARAFTNLLRHARHLVADRAAEAVGKARYVPAKGFDVLPELVELNFEIACGHDVLLRRVSVRVREFRCFRRRLCPVGKRNTARE